MRPCRASSARSSVALCGAVRLAEETLPRARHSARASMRAASPARASAKRQKSFTRDRRARRRDARSRDARATADDVETNRRATRRDVVLVGVAVASRASRARADDAGKIIRAPSSEHGTIAAALATARSGDVIELAPGAVFEERVVVDVDGVTVVGAGGSRAVVRHVTSRPYESALEVRARNVIVRDVTFEHASKSVANNYAVFVTEGASARFEGCDARSDTGSGWGAEGADVELVGCAGRGCATHGFVGLGGLADSTGKATLQGCVFEDNAADGALIRGGCIVRMIGCVVRGNGRYGVELIDCEGELKENNFSRNAKGSTSATNGAERFVSIS